MMYITEKPYSVDRLRERLRYEYEDDTLKAAERKKRAETVAVNLEWVMAQGKMAYPVRSAFYYLFFFFGSVNAIFPFQESIKRCRENQSPISACDLSYSSTHRF